MDCQSASTAERNESNKARANCDNVSHVHLCACNSQNMGISLGLINRLIIYFYIELSQNFLNHRMDAATKMALTYIKKITFLPTFICLHLRLQILWNEFVLFYAIYIWQFYTFSLVFYVYQFQGIRSCLFLSQLNNSGMQFQNCIYCYSRCFVDKSEVVIAEFVYAVLFTRVLGLMD